MERTGWTRVAAVVALGVAATAWGCASSGVERSQRVAASMEDTRGYIAQTRSQTAATMTALSGLEGKSGDALRTQYRQFTQEFERLQSLANDLERQARTVQARGEQQLKAWQEEEATLQDPALRRRAEARRLEQAGRYDAFQKEVAETQRTLNTFLADLRDVRNYLDLDLSPQGVAAVQDKIAAADRDMGPVQQSLARLNQNVTMLAQRVSPGGAPAQTAGGPAAAGAAGATAMDPAAVSEVQEQLKAAGFDPGSTSGVMDEGTQNALRQYQQARGFPATGQLDARTREALRAGSSGAAGTGTGGASPSSPPAPRTP